MRTTAITRNLFLDGREQREAIFIECSREGINLIDNNIFWNVEGRFRPEDVPKEPGSTGWYKMEEHGIVNGYAVYGEGTDRLHVEHNLIGRCRSAGYYVKPVVFRISGPGSRGGTGREARIRNNLFYDCGEAAIKFPTRDNDAQGNAYIQMPGGYLRVLYPAPETCLHLDAWQEFYGFDREGQEGWFTICVDTERLTLEMKSRSSPRTSIAASRSHAVCDGSGAAPSGAVVYGNAGGFLWHRFGRAPDARPICFLESRLCLSNRSQAERTKGMKRSMTWKKSIKDRIAF